MNTYLFAWNPDKWPWPGINKDSRSLISGNRIKEEWNCVSYKKVKLGDRAFFTRVGSEPRGIFASGHVASELFAARSRKGKEVFNVMVEFDVLLDPAVTPILNLELLNFGKLARQLWTPQSSGISIKPELTEELEALWQDFLAQGDNPI